MRTALLLLFTAAAICSAEILFSDDFEDGNADGWTQISAEATYFVGGGWYHMLHSQSENCSAGSFSGDQAGSMSVPDYSLLTEIYPRDGQAGPVVRFDPGTGSGYWFVMNPELDGVALVKMSQSGAPVVLATGFTTLSYLDYYWMRIEVSGSMLGGKVWQGSPGDEPDEWFLTAEDNSITAPGSICLYAHDTEPGGTATVHNDYDNIEVVDDLTLALEPLTWAGIKAALQ